VPVLANTGWAVCAATRTLIIATRAGVAVTDPVLS
jgi:hypothetical protein